MIKANQLIIGLLLLLIGILISAESFADAREAQKTMEYYIDLKRSGNIESARGIWEPATLARSERLEINYHGVDLKVDMNSPLLKDFDVIKNSLNNCVSSQTPLEDSVIRWRFHVDANETKYEYYYYTIKKNGYYWLISSADYYSRNWPVKTSKYFRFYYNPVIVDRFNDIAVAALDAFVEKTASSLAVSSARLDFLEEMKIDYYMCDNDIEVEKLSGKRVRSTYDIASDAIITTVLADYNGVAKLLINFAMQNSQAATASFIREGLAALFGGQWQRSPGVVLDFGKYIKGFNLVEMDTMLLYNANADSVGMADIIMPVAACFSDYLRSKLDYDSLFALYRALSGDYRTVSNLSLGQRKTIVAEALGATWENLDSDFVSYLDSKVVHRGNIFPGARKGSKKLIDDECGLKIVKAGEWLNVEFVSSESEMMDITVLFGKDETLIGKSSVLFEEQHGGQIDFEGYRWGLKLDKNEIGLYDYATNEIRAKYISNSDGASEYFDADKKIIRAYFGKDIIGGKDNILREYKILK